MTNSDLILKQGYKPIIISLVIVLLLQLFISSFLSNIVLVITLFLVFIYRNPSRHIFENSKSVLAPIDGKVMSIDYVNGKQKIYCKVSLCNTHILRAPQSGNIKVKKYQHGLNLNPNSYKANVLNEQITLKFNHIKLKLISGICNTNIIEIEDKTVCQGEDMGIFLDGIVEMTIKDDYKLLVKIGDKLTSGQTIIFKR